MWIVHNSNLPFILDFRGFGLLNCVFWYFLTCVLIGLVIVVVFLITTSCYKNRQRDDKLFNVCLTGLKHIVAIVIS